MNAKSVGADEALQKLRDGNALYLNQRVGGGDISPALRAKTALEGQNPYAIIIACSDSRVIPESIFSAGLGELFVIRVAGNVIDNHQLGSIEYAAEHLGCKLIVVLGHNKCGAVDAAINHDPSSFIKYITDEIRRAIGDEKDAYRASCLNVRRSVKVIEESLEIQREEARGLKVVGAMYRLEDGLVQFI